MLGFASVSEAPLSQANIALVALAYMQGTTAQVFPGGFNTDAASNITMFGAVAFGAVDDLADVVAQASVSPTGVTSTTNVNDFASLQGKANYTPISAVGNFTAGTLDYSAIAFTDVVSGVTAAVDVTNFEDVDAQARVTPSGTTASTTVNDFAGLYAQAHVTPASTAAFLSIYIGNFADEDAQATAFIPPVSTTINARSIDFDAKSRITTSSVTTNAITADLGTIAEAHVTFDSIDATLFRNLETPDAVRFPYQDYADQYHRSRTLYVTAYEGSSTVYILEQNNTVYINEPQGSNIVYILEQNHTVYIDEPQGSNTVYIAA